MKQPNKDRRALKQNDMDVFGHLFALRFVEGCSNGGVELYMEDDENYHYKCVFDKAWLPDLKDTAKEGCDVSFPK